MEDKNKLNLEFTDNFDSLYWAYNMPLQMWPRYKKEDDDTSEITGYRILNYMPRKERCCNIDLDIGDLKIYCRDAARVLRNLAERFDMMSDGKIDLIYYPDEIQD